MGFHEGFVFNYSSKLEQPSSGDLFKKENDLFEKEKPYD